MLALAAAACGARVAHEEVEEAVVGGEELQRLRLERVFGRARVVAEARVRADPRAVEPPVRAERHQQPETRARPGSRLEPRAPRSGVHRRLELLLEPNRTLVELLDAYMIQVHCINSNSRLGTGNHNTRV